MLEGNLKIEWHSEPLQQVFDLYEPTLPHNWSLFIESLDGQCILSHNLAVLRQFNLVDASAQLPVMSKASVELLNFGDERLFPLDDAFWLFDPRFALVEQPPFHTYLAAQGPGHLPYDPATERELSSWAPVEEWMNRNRAFLGFASAQTVMTVQYV